MILKYFKLPLFLWSIFALFLFFITQNIIGFGHELGNGILIIILALSSLSTLQGSYKALADNGAFSKLFSITSASLANRKLQTKDNKLSNYQDQMLKNKELFDKGLLTKDEFNNLNELIKKKML